MTHLLTAAVEIDPAEVTSLMDRLRSLSFGGLMKNLLLILVLFVLIKLITKLLDRGLDRSKLDRTLHGFLRAGVKILLYFVAAMIVAGSLDIDVSSLIALLSVVGLALSLAIQGALSNLASGIMILTAKPLRVGDYVAVGSDEGFVEDIGMTYTKLATWDRRIVSIPNSTVTSSSIVNYTVAGKRRVDLVVSASYDSKLESVKAALHEAVRSVPGFLEDPAEQVLVSGYGESAIEYTIRAWCQTNDYWDCYFALMEAVKRSFDKHGVEMTYPHLNVHFDKQ